jgi:hypothetical protein
MKDDARATASLTWPQRIDSYADFARQAGFPPCLGIAGRWVYGMWLCGNDYTVSSGYHGGYPRTYLKRVKALFPDKRRALHLFSGKVDLAAFPGDTVDIRADLRPTFVDDAQRLEKVPLEIYDLVLPIRPMPMRTPRSTGSQ